MQRCHLPSTATIATILAVAAPVCLAGQRPDSSKRGRTAVARADSASRRFDRLGMQVFDAEWQAYLVAGDRFYADPEYAEGVQQKFFQSSVFLLRLAVAADSINASAEYHLGQVLARKSYLGFGTWNTDTLNVAVEHLARAERLAIAAYASLKPNIEKALRRERESLDSLRR